MSLQMQISGALAAKPFVKWAGGKGQLLNEIRKKYPADLGGHIKKYAEPFVGGGAILFDVLNKFCMEEVYISDINRELINTYTKVRDDVDLLVDILQDFQQEYRLSGADERKSIFYKRRDMYNTLKNMDTLCVENAALFIFLNRTCFNGLYRVNSKGVFNVLQGDYKNPIICDEQNLRAVSHKLQGVQIIHGDYRCAADFIDGSTFAYFDPPYRPLSATSTFNSYAESGFSDDDQAQLASFIDDMHKRGAYIVASNSDQKMKMKMTTFLMICMQVIKLLGLKLQEL